MDLAERLRRITDLFEEGVVVPLGEDLDGPILLWVNKLNSFQVEEARRDGVARRGMRLADLGKPDNPERAAMLSEVEQMTLDEVRQAWTKQQAEEQYLTALDDVDSDPEWREKLDVIRRMPTLLDEAGAAPDDPRRQELRDLQRNYYAAIAEAQKSLQDQTFKDSEGAEREKLTKEFMERWRQRISLDEFMEERRVTELYFALRVCQATRDGNTYDHAPCDHSQRALEAREQVRGLPEQVIEKSIEALDQLNVTPRDAGNSDAPVSSSAPSEQPSVPEDSTPSTPEAISNGSLTTSASQSLQH
jgi:hypothetical protein